MMQHAVQPAVDTMLRSDWWCRLSLYEVMAQLWSRELSHFCVGDGGHGPGLDLLYCHGGCSHRVLAAGHMCTRPTSLQGAAPFFFLASSGQLRYGEGASCTKLDALLPLMAAAAATVARMRLGISRVMPGGSLCWRSLT